MPLSFLFVLSSFFNPRLVVLNILILQMRIMRVMEMRLWVTQRRERPFKGKGPMQEKRPEGSVVLGAQQGRTLSFPGRHSCH